MISLLLAYALMVLSQTSGPEVIGFLYGQQFKDAALALEPVLPDSQNICADYEAAHFNPISDVLHCAGMLSLILLLLSVPWKIRGSIGNKNVVSSLLWGPPMYYLPAWVGHFVFQKDIPAVFSYGTTFTGWWTGESCAFLELFSGRSLSNPSQWIISMAMAAAMVQIIGASPFDDDGTGKNNERKVKIIKRL
jgi:hypothetical protein